MKEDFSNILQSLDNFLQAGAVDPVYKALDAKSLKQQFNADLQQEERSWNELETDIQHYLENAVKTSHPLYFNQLWGGHQPAAIAGELVAAVANTSMYTHEVAPVATLIEKTLIKKMGTLAGFKDHEGQFTTGGSNGNLMAMVMARYHKNPQVKTKGPEDTRYAVFVSEQAHYSIDKAAHILGMGTDLVWKIPVDALGKMDVERLQNAIEQSLEKGQTPFMVVATAGTTVRGAFDPIEAIHGVAAQYGLWLHVDGAWGASVLLSDQHRDLMKGIEKADSLVWDAHKMMGMPLMCSALIVREAGKMHEAFSTAGTEYIFHEQGEMDDLGPSTMHCGRRADSLKLWFAWRKLGDKAWAKFIDSYFDLAEYAENFIQSHHQLKLVYSREYTNICFQVLPKDDQDVDVFQKKLREKLMKSGKSMVNFAILDDKAFFRLVICNNQTKKEDIESFFVFLLSLS